MTTTITIPDTAALPAKFPTSDTAIANMAKEYLPLTIQGIEDADGFVAVHQARMVTKGHRVKVENVRVALKADALAYGKAVDAEANRLKALLAPIESHLQGQEDRITAEKERIKNAARLKAEAEAKAKAEAEAAALKAEQERLAAERRKLEEEQRALEAERLAAARKLEAERLAATRKLDEERAVLEAERRAHQAKVDAARLAAEAEVKRLADIEAEKQRVADLEKARKEAAERAAKETEARLVREAAAKAEADRLAAIAEEVARLGAETLRPDREKLLAVADAVDAIVIPAVSAKAAVVAQKVSGLLSKAASQIRTLAERLGQEESPNA